MMKKISMALVVMFAITTMAIAAPKAILPATDSKAPVAPKAKVVKVKKSHKKAPKAVVPVAPVKK